MSYFYFFREDAPCKWITKEIITKFPKYLREPVIYKGKAIKFHINLEWIRNESRGANKEWLNEIKVNYINTINELPSGDGIFITGYDSNIKELDELKSRNIPMIEAPCPWVRQLRDQLIEVNTDTYQSILMIDEDHMVHDCYKSIYPKDIIIVQADNYQEKLKDIIISKPVYLMVYAAHRWKDAEDMAEYIENKYPHPDNKLDNYKKTICHWVRQGIFEEIRIKGIQEKLDEIWVICSSFGDRSTKSIVRAIEEIGIKAVVISNKSNIPENFNNNLRIGIISAPIPVSHKKRKEILHIIRKKYGGPIEIARILYEYLLSIILDHPDNKEIVNNKINDLLDYICDDVVWIMAGSGKGLPIQGYYKGKEGVRNFMEKLKYSNLRMTNIEEHFYVKEGNKVDVHLLEEGECTETGKTFRSENIHTWEIDDNKKVIKFRSYNDTFAVHEAFNQN
ncbi:MAG: hypothetical protein JXB50_01520 [Spirochaetes bacterium]|nr:hypothetical protein [Spirochaetota bacterium]